MTTQRERAAAFREKVGLAVGEASMCWSELPSGVFDSTKACNIVDSVVSEYEKEVEELKRERDEWKERSKHGACSFCGHLFEKSDPDYANKCAEHMLSCEKHPIRKIMLLAGEIEKERDHLRAENEELRERLDPIAEAVKKARGGTFADALIDSESQRWVKIPRRLADRIVTCLSGVFDNWRSQCNADECKNELITGMASQAGESSDYRSEAK